LELGQGAPTSFKKGTTQVAAKQSSIVIITTPDRINQEWIGRLSGEADVARIERIGVVTVGVEMVQQLRPDLVIVDRDVEQAEATIRQIFTNVPSSLCIALVPQPDMAVMRRLVAVGARDVLARQVPYGELRQSIRSVLATETDRRERSMVVTGGAGGRGKLVVVTSPKGGVGTTTVATNLAVALRQVSGGNVALLDFGLQFGDVGVQMNLWSKYTLLDLLGNIDDIDDALLGRILQPHSSGVQILLAPNSMDAAGEITADQISFILGQMLERHAYVVVDTWSFLDEVTETLLRHADEVLVVTTPEVPAIKNAKSLLDHMRQRDLTQGRVTLVLNRFPSVDGISLEDVQQHLRHPVGANIPSEGKFVTHSINRGVPVVVSHPESWVAQSLLKLAAYVAGDKVNTISLMPGNQRGERKDQLSRASKELRGLLRFSRNEA
jgi:pilus assembly protein CpaE